MRDKQDVDLMDLRDQKYSGRCQPSAQSPPGGPESSAALVISFCISWRAITTENPLFLQPCGGNGLQHQPAYQLYEALCGHPKEKSVPFLTSLRGLWIADFVSVSRPCQQDPLCLCKCPHRLARARQEVTTCNDLSYVGMQWAKGIFSRTSDTSRRSCIAQRYRSGFS